MVSAACGRSSTDNPETSSTCLRFAAVMDSSCTALIIRPLAVRSVFLRLSTSQFRFPSTFVPRHFR